MKDNWILEEYELSVLSSLFGGDGLFGTKIEKTDDIPGTLKDLWIEKGYIAELDGALRIESSLELVMVTMLDPEAAISFSTDNDPGEICCLYLHGETIVLLLSENDKYHLFWLPFIPAALGAAYQFYLDVTMNGKDDENLMRYDMRSVFSRGASGRICRSGKGLTALEDGADERVPEPDDEGCFRRFQKFIVYSHSECMRRVLEKAEASA